jgi:hypothetical protein
MTRASDTHPKGRDVEQARFMGSAVANGDAPNPRQDHPMNKTNPVTAELLAEWKRLEDAFHDSLPNQGEPGDPGHGKALCQFLYDNSETLRTALSSTPSDTGDELREALTEARDYIKRDATEFMSVADALKMLDKIDAALSKAPQATSVTPCEGSVGHSDHARDDQKWCLAAGRYCKHASVQACKAPQATRSDGEIAERLQRFEEMLFHADAMSIKPVATNEVETTQITTRSSKLLQQVLREVRTALTSKAPQATRSDGEIER